jgi:hypothetical protein
MNTVTRDPGELDNVTEISAKEQLKFDFTGDKLSRFNLCLVLSMHDT